MIGIEACLELLRQEFEREDVKAQVQEFLGKAAYSSKWMLYSDYCLDDKNKPNDVMTFVLVPFISEEKYEEMDKAIGEKQPVDIKHTRSINNEFMEYIKSQAVMSFSFIVNDRQQLFGSDEAEQQKAVDKVFGNLKDTFARWRDNEENQQLQDYYKECVAKIKNQQREVFLKKKVKGPIDVLLITLLGAYYTALILRQLPELTIFGWFPDRDKTNETCDGLAVPFFSALQYGYLDSRRYQFCVGKPDAQAVPFYDNENRIADIICGTLADYNIKDNQISKDKFDEVLQGLMADNMFIKVYRLFVEGGRAHLGIINISAKEQ